MQSRFCLAVLLEIVLAACGGCGQSQSATFTATAGGQTQPQPAAATPQGRPSLRDASATGEETAPQERPATTKSPQEPPSTKPPDTAEDTEKLAKQRARETASGGADEPLPAAPPPTGDLRTRTFGSDWPKFLGPTGDSKSTEKGILTKWPAKGPRIVWKRKLAEGYAPIVISRGRLYEFSRVGDNARCSCVRSETGELLWRFEYPTDYEDAFQYSGGPRCCPIVDEDRVYLYGAEGMLHCLHAETGVLIWKVDTVKDFGVVQNFFGVGSTPVVEGDLLIAQVGGSPEESQRLGAGALDRVKPNGSGIVAFDKKTGEVRYQITDDLASYASPVLATIEGRRWCFVFARSGLVGFEPASGQVDFHFPWRDKSLESVNASNPVVVGDEVLISETYGPGSALLQVSPGKYRVVWSDEGKGRDVSLHAHWNTPVHVDGHVYACSGRHTQGSDLRCLDWKTGEVKWQQDSVNFRNPLNGKEEELPITRSSLTYVEGHFLCLNEFGLLMLLKADPRKFELVAQALLLDEAGGRSRQLIQYPAWAAPILSHGLLYLRGEGMLVCLELIPPPQK